jgi:ABC-type lipoprotein export system ATPase subunit
VPVHEQPAGARDLEELRRRAAEAAAPQREDGLVVCESLVRIYRSEGVEVQALQGLDLAVAEGEMVAVVGASGSGKSTLLGILSGQDVPTAGAAAVDGHDLLAMKRRDRLRYRRSTVGFVWQQTSRNLLPYLSAAENVMLPMDFCGKHAPSERPVRALRLLEQVGVADAADKLPAALSGGEQQRVAIARALANDPPIVVADEPTGNLDSRSAEAVFDLFAALVGHGKTIVMVTHDRDLARRVSRTVTLADGAIVGDVANTTGPAPGPSPERARRAGPQAGALARGGTRP